MPKALLHSHEGGFSILNRQHFESVLVAMIFKSKRSASIVAYDTIWYHISDIHRGGSQRSVRTVHM